MSMEKKLYIKPFDLKIDNNLLMEDFSIDFTNLNSICLLGESGCGKSVLLSTLKKYSPKGISFYMLEDSKNQDYIKELKYHSLNSEQKELVDIICVDKHFISYKIALLKTIFSSNKYLFLEDVHFFLNHYQFHCLFDYIFKHGISLFYVTNEVEDVIWFDYLLIVKNKRIAIEGRTLAVLKEEKLLKMLGYSLPFYVNMCIQLGYYGLLKKVCFSKEELESALWK